MAHAIALGSRSSDKQDGLDRISRVKSSRNEQVISRPGKSCILFHIGESRGAERKKLDDSFSFFMWFCAFLSRNESRRRDSYFGLC